MRLYGNERAILDGYLRMGYGLRRAYQLLREWSVQGSNLRPPVNVSRHCSAETPSRPTTDPSKSRLSPRKDGETAHPMGNQTAIRHYHGFPPNSHGRFARTTYGLKVPQTARNTRPHRVQHGSAHHAFGAKLPPNRCRYSSDPSHYSESLTKMVYA